MTAPPNRCAHCLIDHRGEQRYAALPGWHDWARDTFRIKHWDNTYGYLTGLASQEQT